MMPGERPVAVLVFAILNIVFGVLGSLCSVCSGLGAEQDTREIDEPTRGQDLT
jgi:hypothetical protein